MPKVIVGMSGGVDSAVCAYLLKTAGYDVTGITLKTWQGEDGGESRCCEINDASRSAVELGISYYVKNCLSDFRKFVIDPFTDAYLCGQTPNPCVLCNRLIKWEGLTDAARAMGADFVATGHYASVIKLSNGRYTIKRSAFSKKDQSYMLYRLSQEQLKRTIMPLGNLSKEEVRIIAKSAGLSVFSKPDSQEICFVGDGDYWDFIEEYSEKPIPGEGFFVDEGGKILGSHKGITHYTVGQRKGLGVALGHPVFVKEIRPESNEIVLADEESLYTKSIFCNNLNLLSVSSVGECEGMRCRAKIRYHHEAQDATLFAVRDDAVRVDFDSPVKAPAPGQSAVFYDSDDCLIGGGIIRGDERE